MSLGNFHSQNDTFYRPKYHKRAHPERDIQNAVIQFLNLQGHFVWKTPNRGFRMNNGAWIPSGTIGVPDILGVQKNTGRIIAIEIKVPGGKPTEAQISFLEAIKVRGGIGIVAISIEDVMLKLSTESILE